MAFVLFGVGLVLLAAARACTPPEYTACGCSDAEHDDPGCSRFGKK